MTTEFSNASQETDVTRATRTSTGKARAGGTNNIMMLGSAGLWNVLFNSVGIISAVKLELLG